MAHPCDGHTCDNCSICQSGRCCLTANAAAPPSSATLTADERQALGEAMAAEALTHPTPAALLRLDVHADHQVDEVVPAPPTWRPRGLVAAPVVAAWPHLDEPVAVKEVRR